MNSRTFYIKNLYCTSQIFSTSKHLFVEPVGFNFPPIILLDELIISLAHTASCNKFTTLLTRFMSAMQTVYITKCNTTEVINVSWSWNTMKVGMIFYWLLNI